MIIIYVLLIFVSVSCVRVLYAKYYKLENIEFGIGCGPNIAKYKISVGWYLINAIPIVEYAKLPTGVNPNVTEDVIEICLIDPKHQSGLNLVCIVVFVVGVLGLSIWLNREIFNDVARIWSEFVSLYGMGDNEVTAKTVWGNSGILGLYYTFLVGAIINLIPLSVTPMGVLLGLSKVKSCFLTYCMVLVSGYIVITAIIVVIW